MTFSFKKSLTGHEEQDERAGQRRSRLLLPPQFFPPDLSGISKLFCTLMYLQTSLFQVRLLVQSCRVDPANNHDIGADDGVTCDLTHLVRNAAPTSQVEEGPLWGCS